MRLVSRGFIKLNRKSEETNKRGHVFVLTFRALFCCAYIWASAVNDTNNARLLGSSSCSYVNNNNTSNTNSNNGFRVVVRPWKYLTLGPDFGWAFPAFVGTLSFL